MICTSMLEMETEKEADMRKIMKDELEELGNCLDM